MKTCKVYRLPLTTLGVWFKKKCNISIWLPIVKSLSFINVIKTIPISPISNSLFQSYEENITKTKRMMSGLKKCDMKILTRTKIYFGVTTNIDQSFFLSVKLTMIKDSENNRPFLIINE